MALVGVASADFVWLGGSGTINADQWGNQANWNLTEGDTWAGTVGPGATGQPSGDSGDAMYKAHTVIGESITIQPLLEGWKNTVTINNNSTVSATFSKFQGSTITVESGSTFNVVVNGDVKDGQTYTIDGTMILDASGDDSNLSNVSLTLGNNASFTLKGCNHGLTYEYQQGKYANTGTVTINTNLFGTESGILSRTLIGYDSANIVLERISCNFGENWTNVGAEGEITEAYQYKLVNTSNGLTVEYAVNIPEPTTATLSLLALAGLAARRRRR